MPRHRRPDARAGRGGRTSARPGAGLRARRHAGHVRLLRPRPVLVANLLRRPGARREAEGQCRAGRGLGFVVHGLWPQYTRGYPSNCSSVERSRHPAGDRGAGQVYPSEGLARHEWRTHGTCSGLDPVSYFQAARDARAAVTVPDAFKAPRARHPDGADRDRPAVRGGQPGLRPDMMSVTCRSGQLQEVRSAFAKDLRAASPPAPRWRARIAARARLPSTPRGR